MENWMHRLSVWTCKSLLDEADKLKLETKYFSDSNSVSQSKYLAYNPKAKISASALCCLPEQVLANKVTRAQYDRALKLQETTERRYRGKWYYTPDFEERSRTYRWAELKQKMQHERYHKYYRFQEDSTHIDEDEGEGSSSQHRSPFLEVLKSTFLSLFLLQTFGARLSLTFSSLVALLDRKLDAGYKIGYLIAWLLGGRAGVLLALCLSFASWVCGKSSSSVVAVVVVAMWVGSNLARYAPLPQGAVLTLLYMSIKLQADLNWTWNLYLQAEQVYISCFICITNIRCT